MSSRAYRLRDRKGLSALGVSPGRFGAHYRRARRQLFHSNSRRARRLHHSSFVRAPRSLVVLRDHGDSRIGDRRLSYYRIGEKGGEETLEKKIGKQRAQKVYKRVESAGFTSIIVSVLIPPPFPIVPVLLAAGALKYPVRKFLAAIALGRAVRFTIDAMLGIYFGRSILRFFSQYYKPALYTLIALAIVGGIGGLIYYKRWRAKQAAWEFAPSTAANERRIALTGSARSTLCGRG